MVPSRMIPGVSLFRLLGIAANAFNIYTHQRVARINRQEKQI